MRFGILLLSVFATLASTARLAERSSPDYNWEGPLSTSGRYVIDANGNRFRMRGGNWHGGSGTWTGSGDPNDPAQNHAGEVSHNMPLGLQYVPIDQIIASFVELNVNTIRLQFSSQMIHDTSIINSTWVAANPQFIGMTCLQVYDKVVEALTAANIAVIMNYHTITSIWCCGVDGNERWDESQSFDDYAADWVMMAERFASNKRVVGADLYNEVRRDILTDPNWGNGDSADWQQAAQYVSNQILTANPDLLIVVEGINWVGIPVDGFSHGRPDLTPVSGLSITTIVPHKLVYSAHFYGYTGPANSGAGSGLGATSDPTYAELSLPDLQSALLSEAFYVSLTAQMHYTAPVWISEFGIAGRGDEGNTQDTTFWQNFINYLIAVDAEYAFWPLVGYLNSTTLAGNGWALMNWEQVPGGGKRVGLFDGDDWRQPSWTQLSTSTNLTGPVAQIPEWKQINIDHGDSIQSVYALANLGDWDNGAYKAMCPDNLRLIGMGHNSDRGLCTDVGFGTLWASNFSTMVVNSQEYVNTANGDWASGFTKFQCPPNYFVSGWSIRGSKMSAVMCAQAKQVLGTNGHTVWFNQGDNRADTLGGDFANGEYKGSCATNEYIGGVAFTTAVFQNGEPDAIYCVS